jgi:hypothetical protein
MSSQRYSPAFEVEEVELTCMPDAPDQLLDVGTENSILRSVNATSLSHFSRVGSSITLPTTIHYSQFVAVDCKAASHIDPPEKPK